MDVYIGGRRVRTVDTYEGGGNRHGPLYENANLIDAAVRSVKVVCTGERRCGSSGG